ncbi:unnamed protein product [Schistocephalus solidus]|uniref:BACK domain-containing protein n=2 Tax=Schistocephalus solidus TaxID=70667 RepID=A0A183T678_SCHSO|nr:unnamed protein product [Schistocephalus solidus]
METGRGEIIRSTWQTKHSAGDIKQATYYSSENLNPGMELPDNLLMGYRMQWALNQPLALVNGRKFVYVNVYKLATQSRTFKSFLREVNKERKNQKTKACVKNSKCAVDCVGAVEPLDPLLVQCTKASDVHDLALAIHFCHIGHCRISAIADIDRADEVPPRKRRESNQWPSVSESGQLLLSTSQIHLTSAMAECTLASGLRIAKTYGIDDLQRMCVEYISKSLSLKSCWDLWRAVFPRSHLQEMNDPHAVLQKAIPIDEKAAQLLVNFVRTNFVRILRSTKGSDGNEKLLEGLINLSAYELELLLDSDRLNVRSESDVLWTLKLWIDGKSKCPGSEAFLSQCVPRLVFKCIRSKQLAMVDVDSLFKLPGMRQARRQQHTVSTSTQENPLDGSTKFKEDSVDVQSACLEMLHQARRKLFRTLRNLRPLVDSKGLGHSSDGDNVAMTIGSGKGALGFINSKSTDEMTRVVKQTGEQRLPHEAIFVFGGWENGKLCSKVRVLDARMGTWVVHESASKSTCGESSEEASGIVLPHPLMSFGITKVNNRTIYIAGGEKKSGQATQEVIRYDFQRSGSGHQDWKGCPPMHEIRRDLILVNFEEKALYSIGGDNNRTVLMTVERLALDKKTNSWTEVASMLVPRGAPAGDVLGGQIYVCGGYTESRMEALTNSCEAYNPETNQWTLIQPMAQPRYYANAIAYKNHLFVLGGGGDNASRLGSSVMALGYSSTVERYTPEDGIWELMPAISERADFAACMMEGSIVCIGGGGEAFCTADTELWAPWVGNARPTNAIGPGAMPSTPRVRSAWAGDSDDDALSVSERPGTSTDPIPRHSTSRGMGTPAWMNAQNEETDLGWRPGVALPSPVWGHRCVCMQGVDIILPYLKRKHLKCEPLVECVAPARWKIDRQAEKFILTVDYRELDYDAATLERTEFKRIFDNLPPQLMTKEEVVDEQGKEEQVTAKVDSRKLGDPVGSQQAIGEMEDVGQYSKTQNL